MDEIRDRLWQLNWIELYSLVPFHLDTEDKIVLKDQMALQIDPIITGVKWNVNPI